jgi:membrane dipeptidase
MHFTYRACRFIFFILLVHYSAIAQKKNSIHFKSILVDTHNDVLSKICENGINIATDLKGKTHSDLQRFKEGGVDVQIFSVWCGQDYGNGTAYNHANREIDSLYALVQRNPDKIEIAYKPSDIKRILRKGKLVAMIGVEGGHMIEDKLSNLDSLYKRGTRYMTLTWNNSTSWATSASDETTKKDSLKHKGLNDFGKQVVKRMNELGMMVDISHVGEQTFWDAINTTTKPVIASHSCAWNLCPVFRNLKNDQIIAVGKNRGVICLNFFSGFVDSSFQRRDDHFKGKYKAEWDSVRKTMSEDLFADIYLFEKYPEESKDLRPPLGMLLDHLDYIVKLIGVDHVGMGSDFDGINSAPKGLDGVEDFPKITEALLERGYSKKQIRKILGGNVLRVFRANQKM